MLEYCIPLQVDDTLDSLDDYLNRRRILPLRGNGKKYGNLPEIFSSSINPDIGALDLFLRLGQSEVPGHRG